MADVFELAHIARKVEGLQTGQCCVRDALGLHSQLTRALLQEVARQSRHVFLALTQRRQAQADHVQAVEQVLAEHAVLDAGFQVLVRRGNHAHIRLHGRMAAHTVEMPVGQHTQQSRLQIERHVADFIEEQRAALGLLEATTALRLRAGERTALVAEQFAFQQILGNGRRVDRHERPTGHGRVLVQRASHQFLARARFAGDQHRHRALAQTTNRAKHVLHRRCLTEDFGRSGLTLFGHLLALAFFDRAADQLHGLGQIERLGQVFERTALQCGDGAVKIRIRRHDDHRQAGLQFAQLLQKLQARATGHPDVADQHLRAAVFRVTGRYVGQRVQHLARVREAAGGQILARQCFFQDEADRGVVIYYPDRLHVFLLPC